MKSTSPLNEAYLIITITRTIGGQKVEERAVIKRVEILLEIMVQTVQPAVHISS